MKSIVTTGKRKAAVARATLKAGTGKITINNVSIEAYQPAIARLKLKEPLILAEKEVAKLKKK